MPRDIKESHAARRRERIDNMVRTLPKLGRPPLVHAPEPEITAAQRAALERASRAKAEEEPASTAPARKVPSLLEERQASAPPRGEVFVSGHFAEPILAGRRSFLRLRDELTVSGSAWERYAESVFERRDDEGYVLENVDAAEDYLSLGRDPDRPAFDRLVRLQRYSPAALEKLLGGHRRKVKRARPVDALTGVGFLAGTPDRFTSAGVTAGRPAIRGAAIVPAYARQGYVIRPAGGHLLAELPGGRDPSGIVQLLEVARARDLVHGWAIGQPVACEHPDHAGDPVPAVTVALADVLVCADCMAGRFAVAVPGPSTAGTEDAA